VVIEYTKGAGAIGVDEADEADEVDKEEVVVVEADGPSGLLAAGSGLRSNYKVLIKTQSCD
jgi:hypothetical protein